MTMILVDPAELTAAADTLRSCAIESADIGSELWACAQCPMPPAISGLINDLVAAADRALDSSAAHLQLRSVELTLRAAIAAHDPITAASVATAPAAQSTSVGDVLAGMNVVGGTGGPDFTIEGGGNSLYPTSAIVGGSSGPGFTIEGPGFFPTGSIVGGSNSFMATSGITSGSGLLGPMVIGGGSIGGSGANPMSGVMALAQTAQNFRERAQARINRIVANSSVGSPAFQIAMNAQWGLGDQLSHTLAPSVRELEEQYGPLTESAIEAISPHTLSRPVNLFEGVGFG